MKLCLFIYLCSKLALECNFSSCHRSYILKYRDCDTEYWAVMVTFLLFGHKNNRWKEIISVITLPLTTTRRTTTITYADPRVKTWRTWHESLRSLTQVCPDSRNTEAKSRCDFKIRTPVWFAGRRGYYVLNANPRMRHGLFLANTQTHQIDLQTNKCSSKGTQNFFHRPPVVKRQRTRLNSSEFTTSNLSEISIFHSFNSPPQKKNCRERLWHFRRKTK